MQVLYHPRQANMFISGSLDGLINVADFSGGLDEDDSFKVRGGVLPITWAILYP